MKALVADDNDANLYMLESLLKGNGYEVVSARNGEEALEMLRVGGADIIVSDILMPEMDGYMLCRSVKADPVLKDIPFVFYTATYTDPKDFEFGLSLGADRFLVKPMDPEAILQVLGEVIAGRASSLSEGDGYPSSGETEFLRLHNETLFRKLEKKVVALEETNLGLEREMRTRERVEAEFRESERRFREALEFLPVPIGIAEKSGRMLFYNREFTRRFGYTVEETPTIDDWMEKGFPDPAYRAAARDMWNADSAFAAGKGTAAPARLFRMTARDGGERIVEISMSPAGGLFLFAYNDVTEQHRTEELLRRSQKMEALGTMAGGVAHDFNNILTVILSCATLLKMHIAKDAKTDSHVNEIIASVDRAADLTRSLLAFSRKQATKLEPGDIGKVVSTLEKSLRRLIREDIVFRIHRQDGTVPVLMDKGQVEQVIVNLVVNARDAMLSGGVLSISSSAIDVAGNEARLPDGMGPGRYALLAVSDTGVGMDAETRQRIFEPFFTTKETGKGTGLGLSIVYGIVTGHGGFLRVSSEKGCGTTFEVFLPLIRDGGEAPVELPEAEGKRGSGTVLLVEDEEAVRTIIGKVLEDKGYRVLSAPNGESGLAVFREHADEVLLVVSDLVMPRMNGRKMCDGIRRIKEDVPFVFMSGYPDDIVLDGVEGGGRTVYLQKPVKPAGLLDVVNEIIGATAFRG